MEKRQARAYTRNGLDWSSRYPSIIKQAAKLHSRSVILDGEVIVQNERGASDFDALKFAMKWQPHKLIFYASKFVT
jgi:bifunctional non-homologous end joining protein LigD